MVIQALEDMKIGFEAGFAAPDQDQPTLVMIHGAGGSSRTWQGQTFPLNNSINTIALDLPAHGTTAGEGWSSITEYSKWLIRAINTVFQRPLFLMGHSLGGAVVQEAALLDSHLMKGIILAGTGPRLPVAPSFLDGLQKDFEGTVDTIMSYAYSLDADPSLIEEGGKLMKEAGSSVVHSDFLACDRFDVRTRLGEIDLPCLVLCGDKDKMTPPALSEELNKSIKGSKYKTIPSAGHMLMIENHKAFNKYVLDFILETSC